MEPIETLGNGSILIGLAWLIGALALLIIVAAVAAVLLVWVWRGGDPIGSLSSVFQWIGRIFKRP